ncbi:hypothetical protein JST97_15770 [bacterium]|nr:hypothetical protein [bacterium]
MMIQNWMKKFCLAICLVLSLACTASVTQQRLHILQALQGTPSGHVPQMLMTLDRAGLDLSISDLASLPLLLELEPTPTLPLPQTEFVARFVPQAFCATVPQLRGPPVVLRSMV